jgi:hypothetical protein
VAAEGRSAAGHGLLLVRRSAAPVTRWLRKGVVSTTVAPFGAWTGVTVAEDRARSAEPYDIGLEVLVARPAPRSARPVLGFVDVHQRAVITVQTGGLRGGQHWLVWEPGHGVVDTPSLPRLHLSTLLSAAHASGPVRAEDVGAVLRSTAGAPLDLLVTVLALLGLPGRDLLVDGDSEGASEVQPSVRSVLAFDRLVADEADRHAEWSAAWGGRPPGAADGPSGRGTP